MEHYLKTEIPADYLDRMSRMLGAEFDEFVKIYEREPERALRFNPLRARPETIEQLKSEWQLEQVPWCPDGWYYDKKYRPGLSPLHDAGVYYIQEPSAMVTCMEADIGSGDIVLDLCASPGGKATQAAASAALVVANEPVASRARVLSSNIERMGFSNCIVTSAYPGELSAALPGLFDCVIVDAPCSGEGMMRKEEAAARQWSAANVSRCADRQRDILESAALMTKNGGRIVYSTCTFEPEENERQAETFAKTHKEFKIKEMKRLMPHKIRGEGHFCAVLEKTHGETGKRKKYALKDIEKILKKAKIHILRSGVEKGESKKTRSGESIYIPSHAEAMSRDFGTDNAGKINISSYDFCMRYLRGGSIDLAAQDVSSYCVLGAPYGGWVTVYYDRYPLGNAKIVGGILKNHYPRGLRRY